MAKVAVATLQAVQELVFEIRTHVMPIPDLHCRLLKGGCSRGGVFLGNPEDSVWEDWGTLGNIGED